MLLSRLSRALDTFLVLSAIVMVLVMVAGVFVQIVARNFFSSSFEAVDELARFLLVWLTFVGSAITYKRGGHLGMGFFVALFSGNVRKVLQKVAKIMDMCFFAFLIFYGFQMASMTMRQATLQMRIPVGCVYSIMPISGLAMLVHALDSVTNGKDETALARRKGLG